jgi:hypothetical protein
MLLAAAHNSQDVFMQADIEMYENNKKKTKKNMSSKSDELSLVCGTS